MVTVVLSLVINLTAAVLTTRLLRKVDAAFDWVLRAVNILTYAWVAAVVFALVRYFMHGAADYLNALFVGLPTVLIPVGGLVLTWMTSMSYLRRMLMSFALKPQIPKPRPTFVAATVCDRGRGEKLKNEDVVLALPERGLFAAIDGMGGHEGGDIAAKILSDELTKTCVDEPTVDKLVTAFEQAEKAMIAKSQEFGLISRNYMGCVASVFWMEKAGDEVMITVGHIGDTRGYASAGGKLQQVTRDHSVVPIALPEIEQLRHPERNLVTASLGVEQLGRSMTERGNFFTVKYPVGSCFLLLTDGVTDALLSGDIAKLVDRFASAPQILADKLFTAAMLGQLTYKPKGDNIGIVVVKT